MCCVQLEFHAMVAVLMGGAAVKSRLLLAVPFVLSECVEPTTNNLPSSGGGSTGTDDSTGASMSDAPLDADSSSATAGDDETASNDETSDPAPACDPETSACISKVPDGWNAPSLASTARIPPDVTPGSTRRACRRSSTSSP